MKFCARNRPAIFAFSIFSAPVAAPDSGSVGGGKRLGAALALDLFLVWILAFAAAPTWVSAQAPANAANPPNTAAQAPSVAQKPQEKTDKTGTTTEDKIEQPLQSNANEVSIALVARDKRNRPVLNLTEADLRVMDAGSPVKLTHLRLVSGANAEAFVTLVFDQMSPSGARNAQFFANKFLAIQQTKSFSIAVMSIDGRLRLLQPFQKDRAGIGAALEQAGGVKPVTYASDSSKPENDVVSIARTGADITGREVSPEDRALAEATLKALEESQRIVLDQHAKPSYAGLQALAHSQEHMPGRRVILYFSEGLQQDADTQDMVKATIQAANRAGVSIYAIDCAGLSSEAAKQLGISQTAPGVGAQIQSNLNALMATQGAGAPGSGNSITLQQGKEQLAGNGGPGATDSMGQMHMAISFAERFEANSLTDDKPSPMNTLANGAGGIYITTGDNPKKPLARMIQEITTYYEASYVPDIKDYNGQFRPILIQPLRPNLQVRARAGYFALPPEENSGTEIRPFEAPLMKLLDDAQPPSDVDFRADVLRMGNTPGKSPEALVVEAPISRLEVRKDPNTKLYSIHVGMVAQIKNKSGAVLEHFSEDIPRHGALETLDSIHSESLTMQRHFSVPPGDYVLEAAVLDSVSGQTGVKRTNFTVEPPPHGPSISDIALVGHTEPFRGLPDPLEPLQYAKVRIVPSLSEQIAPDARQISLFFLIHPEAGASSRGDLVMDVTRDGKPVGHTPLTLGATAGLTAIPYMGSLQAASLPSGHYEVAITMNQDGKIAGSEIGFNVGGEEVADASSPADASATGGGVSNTAGNPGAQTWSRFTLASASSATKIPPKDALDAVLGGATERALHYSQSLPNFLCVERTERSVDNSGTGKWRHKDSIVEMLRYRNQAEARQMLEINGRPSKIAPEDLKGTTLMGEFGGVLHAIFNPDSKTAFEWKETDALGSGTVEVFGYRVEMRNSSFSLTGRDNRGMTVAYHGLVYIDDETRGVRRVTLEAEGMPNAFTIHATSITIDYDYIGINGHDYLLPVHGELKLRQGKHQGIDNQFEFRDYHRFSSEARMVDYAEVK